MSEFPFSPKSLHEQANQPAYERKIRAAHAQGLRSLPLEYDMGLLAAAIKDRLQQYGFTVSKRVRSRIDEAGKKIFIFDVSW